MLYRGSGLSFRRSFSIKNHPRSTITHYYLWMSQPSSPPDIIKPFSNYIANSPQDIQHPHDFCAKLLPLITFHLFFAVYLNRYAPPPPARTGVNRIQRLYKAAEAADWLSRGELTNAAIYAKQRFHLMPTQVGRELKVTTMSITQNSQLNNWV